MVIVGLVVGVVVFAWSGGEAGEPNERHVQVFGPSQFGLSMFGVEVRRDGSVEVIVEPEQGGCDDPLWAVPYP